MLTTESYRYEMHATHGQHIHGHLNRQPPSYPLVSSHEGNDQNNIFKLYPVDLRKAIHVRPYSSHHATESKMAMETVMVINGVLSVFVLLGALIRGG